MSSSGTLAVVNSVSVLAQMNGRIETLNVDYNDRVKKGEVLATINTDLLKPNEQQAQAAVDKAEANYELQLLAVKNAQTLAAKGLLSDYDLKTSEATLGGGRRTWLRPMPRSSRYGPRSTSTRSSARRSTG